MISPKFYWIASLAALVVGPSLGATAKDCDHWRHEGPSFQRGEAMLGSEVRVDDIPPGWTPGENCLIDRERSYIDCEFTDGNGISFLVHGDEIIRKEIRAQRRAPNELPYGASGELPFGLTLPLSIDKIIRSQVLRGADFPEMLVSYAPAGGTHVSTDYCIVNGAGVSYSLAFQFDKIGRFTSISARILWG